MEETKIPKTEGRSGFLVGEENGKTVIHKDGNKGGVIHGNRHSDGGVAAVNTGTGQPLEVEKSEVSISPDAVNANETHEFKGKHMTNKEILSEINQSGGGVPIKKAGGTVDIKTNAIVDKRKGDEIKYPSSSVIITRPAVFDDKKHMFDGKYMTNLQILSLLNERAGGVAFSEKDLPEKMSLKGNKYEWGGKMVSDLDIAKECGCRHEMEEDGDIDNLSTKAKIAYVLAEKDYQKADDGQKKEFISKLKNNLDRIKDKDDELSMDFKAAGECFLAKYDTKEVLEKGGITEERKEIYEKWKGLINMSASSLRKFYDSAEGRVAGLTHKAAQDLGIHSGRESARWIMKMKETPVGEWTNKMWEWAQRQISFVSRMRGNKGDLYDKDGKKTRKHLSLLIWGHNPNKEKGSKQSLENGGYISEGNYATFSPKLSKKTIKSIQENKGGFILDSLGTRGVNATDFIYTPTAKAAYGSSLARDNENFRLWKVSFYDGHVILTYGEFSIFGDTEEDPYDDNGILKQSIKDSAIKQIEKELEIHPKKLVSGGEIEKSHGDKIFSFALEQFDETDETMQDDEVLVDGIKPIVTQPNTLYSDTINHERELANALLTSSQSKLAKVAECSNRIEYAKEWAVATINEEQNMWSDILYLWENCLKNIKILELA